MQYHGTTTYVYIKGLESIKLKKLVLCAKKGHLVSYKGNNSHIYYIWIPTENKIIRSHNIIFNEAPDLPITILKNKLTI